jgi:hypothetical protein
MRQPALQTSFSLLAVLVAGTASLAGVALAGCGGGDDNQSEVDRLREEVQQLRDDANAREAARLRERVASQRREIADLKRQLASKGGGSGGGESSTQSSGSTSCGEGLSVNSATTCSFARNVRDAYRDSGGASEIDVYSPVTRRTYTMRCTAGVTTVCTGGNNAAVYIR